MGEGGVEDDAGAGRRADEEREPVAAEGEASAGAQGRRAASAMDVVGVALKPGGFILEQLRGEAARGAGREDDLDPATGVEVERGAAGASGDANAVRRGAAADCDGAVGGGGRHPRNPVADLEAS